MDMCNLRCRTKRKSIVNPSMCKRNNTASQSHYSDLDAARSRTLGGSSRFCSPKRHKKKRNTVFTCLELELVLSFVSSFFLDLLTQVTLLVPNLLEIKSVYIYLCIYLPLIDLM